jgi:hypothetical protein
MSANNASIMAVLGSSGSGKSTFIKRTLSRGHPRLLIWDPMGEYEGAVIAGTADLLAGLKAKKFRLVFRPSPDPAKRVSQFDFVCRAALAAGHLTLVVEELRFVTTPSRAPLGWAQVCLTGRHRGLKVYGASQRPASIDKDFLGNCTAVRTGRLAYPEDAKAVCKVMGVPPGEIEKLKPLEWIEKDMATGKISSGVLTF